LKKITVQPTIHDLKPEPPKEPRKDYFARIPLSISNKLEQASRNTGRSKNEIIALALEAFLK